MTDELDPITEERLRAALDRLADAHEPVRQPASALRSAESHGHRRWLATAAAVILLVGAVAVVASIRRDGGTAPADQPTELPEPPASVVEPAPTDPPSSTTTTSTTTTTAPVDRPSTVFDAAGTPMTTYDLAARRAGDDGSRTDFTESLLDHLLNHSTLLGETFEDRERALFRSGLSIHTTLDPELQAAAEDARHELPPNEAGVDAAIVTLDNASGAIRAMVGGADPLGSGRTTNRALVPRGTGSAADVFVLAAGVQAGAQADDLIDGRRGCLLPADDAGTVVFQINGGVAGFIGSLRDILARSVPCGTARLSHTVGLDQVVDTTYAMASSRYLFEGQPESERTPITPGPGFAIGSNAMSPLDMAAGVQTIASLGVHHEPFYVEYIDDADGERRYTRSATSSRALDDGAARVVVDVLKGVVEYGTGRRAVLDGARPSFGQSGTVQTLLDAWFVGATPQLTTAVWVGHPDGSTPMINVPEFGEFARVQGGMFPALIWKSLMDAAHADLPVEDWPEPPSPPRTAARLVLPGFECRLDGSEIEPEAGRSLTTVAVDAEVVPCELDLPGIPVPPDPMASEVD